MSGGELRRLKELVEDVLGYKPKWQQEEPWFGGSVWADLDDGRCVSLMVDPPDGTPQISGLEVDVEPKKGDHGWIEMTQAAMKLVFS